MNGRLLAVLCVTAALACGATTTTASPPAEDGGAPADAGTSSGEDPAAGGIAACPTIREKTTPGRLSGAGSDEIAEVSGIVQSSRNEGVCWVHNDSGDTARAFAIGANGELLTTLTFDTTDPIDVEDMAIEDVSATKSYLYFADIGDNDAIRSKLTIHRVAEPKLDGTSTVSVTSEKMRVTYADGAHDAETLLFDPITKELLIATKGKGGPSAIHRVGPFVAGGSATTKKIAEVDIDLATGGEISRDGRLIGIRNYVEAYVWTRDPAESLADVFARPPCRMPVQKEAQGESLAFLMDRVGFVTVSEGRGAALHVSLFE